MLALLFRGVFFLGVISWYSSSLWKMVDSYFKDQFQRYLDDEFQKNPRMRDDVLGYTAVDKSDNSITNQHTFTKSCESLDICTVDNTGILHEESRTELTVDRAPGNEDDIKTILEFQHDDYVGDGNSSSNVPDELNHVEPPDKWLDQAPNSSFQIETTKNVEENTGFQENCEIELQQPVDINPLSQDEQKTSNESVLNSSIQLKPQGSQQNMSTQNNTNIEFQQLSDKKSRSYNKRKKNTEQKPTFKLEKRSKRKKTPTKLSYTFEDFDRHAWERRFSRVKDDDDFIEFDDEKNEVYEKIDLDGTIPIANLPFKSKVEIYDLDRISKDEFCPLTLDDDTNCNEVKSWP